MEKNHFEVEQELDILKEVKKNLRFIGRKRECIDSNAELTFGGAGFKTETRRTLISRLIAAKEWGTSGEEDLNVRDIARASMISVIDISFLEGNVRDPYRRTTFADSQGITRNAVYDGLIGSTMFHAEYVLRRGLWVKAWS